MAMRREKKAGMYVLCVCKNSVGLASVVCGVCTTCVVCVS